MGHTETAKHECVSDDALQHLKSYKYSSVDKSFISRYILKHYVRPLSRMHMRMHMHSHAHTYTQGLVLTAT